MREILFKYTWAAAVGAAVVASRGAKAETPAAPAEESKPRGVIVLDDSFWNRGKPAPSPFGGIGSHIDYSSKPVNALNTRTVRALPATGRLEPFASVAEQKTDLEETLRYGVGGGVRYRLTKSLSAVFEVLSFGPASHPTANAPEEGESTFMLSLEWKF